jgi:hypothetical protein
MLNLAITSAAHIFSQFAPSMAYENAMGNKAD